MPPIEQAPRLVNVAYRRDHAVVVSANDRLRWSDQAGRKIDAVTTPALNCRSSSSYHAAMDDPVLGDLKVDPDWGGCWVGSIPFESRRVTLRIDPDGGELTASLKLAREMVFSLDAFDKKARRAASKNLLNIYNENWRHFSRARADGSWEEISNPELTEAEFEQRLQFVSLSVVGDVAEFWFGDAELFHGHSVIVTAFDGAAFEETHAALFG